MNINVITDLTEDILPDVDSTAMSVAVIDDGNNIVVPAEVDLEYTLSVELGDDDPINVIIDDNVGAI